MARSQTPLTYDLLLHATLSTLRGAPPGLLPLLGLIMLVPHVVVERLAPRITGPAEAADLMPLLPWLVPLVMIDAFGSAVMALLARAAWVGQPTTPVQLLADGLRLWPMAFVITVLFGLAVGLGSLLFFLPGIAAAVVFMLVLPAVVLEQLGPQAAFRRSFALTQGARWALLALLGLYTVTVILGSSVLGSLVLSESQLVSWIGSILGQSWVVGCSLFGGTALAIAFLRLRELHGG